MTTASLEAIALRTRRRSTLGSHRRLSPGRLDRTAAIDDEIGGLADLVKAGYIRAIGSSEVRRTRKPQ
jgi:hypothetical protein